MRTSAGTENLRASRRNSPMVQSRGEERRGEVFFSVVSVPSVVHLFFTAHEEIDGWRRSVRIHLSLGSAARLEGSIQGGSKLVGDLHGGVPVEVRDHKPQIPL